MLESIGEAVLLGYDSFDTCDNIMKHLIQAENHDFATIIGTSLGGFYAAELAKNLDYPCVMINPAWKPHDVLAPPVRPDLHQLQNGRGRDLGPQGHR